MIRMDFINKRQIPILVLEGELDLIEKPKVEKELQRMIPGANHHTAVDLRGITFIDSAGLAVLLESVKLAWQSEKDLILILGDNEYMIEKFEELGILRGTGIKFVKSIEDAA